MKSTLLRVRNTVLHVLFLIILFIAAMMFFSRMINRTESEDAGEMAQSSFPLIYMQRDNTNFNCLHGYARQMDPSYMNGTVTPLEDGPKSDNELIQFWEEIMEKHPSPEG